MKRLFFLLFIASIACSSDPSTTAAANPGSSAGGSSGASTSSGVSGSSGSSVSSGGTAGSGTADGGPSGDGPSGSGGSGTGNDGASDAAGSTPDASPEARQACAAFATTLCAKINSCTSFVMAVLYGDVATCEKRLALSCLPSFAAPGTTATPAKTTACEQSIPALACGPFLMGNLGPACKTDPGTIATGGACADDAQCATAFCARAPDAACGICQPTTQAGDPCVRSACSAGTACPAGQSTCITPVSGQVNDACTAQEQCDLAHAVGCNINSGKCLKLTLGSSQGSCGADSIFPTNYTVCPASGTCSAALAGKCSPTAADGAACSTADTGTHCMPPARCVAGKCTVPDPTTCR